MIFCLSPVTGCGSVSGPSELGGLYTRAAMHHDETRTPVIVIPGILDEGLDLEN